MKKIKLILTSLVMGVAMLTNGFVSNVSAISPEVSITQLPEYINFNTFKLSYSAISDDPGSLTAQFYVNKNSQGFVAFGPVINGASGQVQVTGNELNEQTKYEFKVTVNSGVSNSTVTNYDVSGPSAPANYWKEKVTPGHYRLHWKNPGDPDFSRVFIYRGDSQGFEANGSHKVGEVGGTPQSESTWDNVGLDPNKDYYYILRAVDKADNSSSLSGDGGVTTITGSPAPTPKSGVVSILPKEKSSGEVLSATTSPSPEGASEDSKEVSDGKASGVLANSDNMLLKLGLGALLVIAGIYIYRKFRSN